MSSGAQRSCDEGRVISSRVCVSETGGGGGGGGEVASSAAVLMEEWEEADLGRREGRRGRWGRVLRRRLPVLEWAPRYDRTQAVADLVAGLTLGLTLVPQSIAYASLANLPVQYGLYSAYVGTFLYVLLGTVKEVSIGPTSLMALLTLQLCKGLPVEFVVLLTFLSGVMVFFMGLLRLGFLVELISPAVTSGFTSATALLVATSQVKGLLGLTFVAESLAENVRLIARHWAEVRAPDVLLGAACCSLLLLLRFVKDIPLSGKRARLRKALWLVSISRNALVVVGASTLAYCLHDPAAPLFKLSGRVQAGVPRVALPPFSAQLGNRTLGFAEMVGELGPGVALVPLVMVLANIAIAKAFSAGRRVDATQEMVTLGLVNVAGALVHAMPTCGAFTRSAVSHSSGVRTPAAGLYSGVITLLALSFLTHYFYFIPKACLSSVLICAVIFMVDTATVARLWGAGERAELGVLALTAGVGVAASVELAVLAGVLASAAALLRRLMAVRVERGACGELRPSAPLLYANCERVARRLLGAARARPHSPLLLDAAHVALLDYTAAQMLERVIKKLKESQQKLIIYRAAPGIIPQLEAIEGVEVRALRAATPDAARRAAGAATPDAGAATPDAGVAAPLLPPAPGPAHHKLETAIPDL